MNKEKCFECIKKATVRKIRLWKENKLTWGEDLELSKILEAACSYAEVSAKEIALAAVKEFTGDNGMDDYIKRLNAWKPGQLWV